MTGVGRATVVVVALLLVAVMYVLEATGVEAHARRESSTPEAGEVLETSPAEVRITFTQEIQKITGTYGIDVINEAGDDVTAADAVLSDEDRTLMTVALQPGLPPGRYVVEYENVSDADGDDFAASFAFYVGRPPTPEEAALDEELLMQEGGEDQPTTEAGSPTVAAETPPAQSTPTASDAATQTPGATSTADGGDDDGGDFLVFAVVGAIVLLAVLVVAGFIAFSRGRSA